MKILVAILLAFAMVSTNVYAHPGKTDKDGYHVNRRTGKKHQHKKETASATKKESKKAKSAKNKKETKKSKKKS